MTTKETVKKVLTSIDKLNNFIYNNDFTPDDFSEEEYIDMLTEAVNDEKGRR